MSKEELRRWLLEHQGPEWEDERERIIEENREVADELLKDAVLLIKESLLLMIDEIVLSDIEAHLAESTEYPEAKELLKRFGVN